MTEQLGEKIKNMLLHKQSYKYVLLREMPNRIKIHCGWWQHKINYKSENWDVIIAILCKRAMGKNKYKIKIEYGFFLQILWEQIIV